MTISARRPQPRGRLPWSVVPCVCVTWRKSQPSRQPLRAVQKSSTGRNRRPLELATPNGSGRRGVIGGQAAPGVRWRVNARRTVRRASCPPEAGPDASAIRRSDRFLHADRTGRRETPRRPFRPPVRPGWPRTSGRRHGTPRRFRLSDHRDPACAPAPATSTQVADDLAGASPRCGDATIFQQHRRGGTP